MSPGEVVVELTETRVWVLRRVVRRGAATRQEILNQYGGRPTARRSALHWLLVYGYVAFDRERGTYSLTPKGVAAAAEADAADAADQSRQPEGAAG